MAAKYDISIEQGADFALSLTLKDGLGDPIDATGETIEAHIRQAWDKPKIAEFSIENSDAAVGKITLILPGADSESIAPGAFFYDVLYVNIDGVRRRIIEGACTIKPAITKYA